MGVLLALAGLFVFADEDDTQSVASLGGAFARALETVVAMLVVAGIGGSNLADFIAAVAWAIHRRRVAFFIALLVVFLVFRAKVVVDRNDGCRERFLFYDDGLSQDRFHIFKVG